MMIWNKIKKLKELENTIMQQEKEIETLKKHNDYYEKRNWKLTKELIDKEWQKVNPDDEIDIETLVNRKIINQIRPTIEERAQELMKDRLKQICKDRNFLYFIVGLFAGCLI